MVPAARLGGRVGSGLDHAVFVDGYRCGKSGLVRAPLLSELYDAPAGAGFERVCEGGQVTPGEAVRAAETRWPGRSLASLYFPFGPGNAYRMAFSAPGDLSSLDGDFVVFAHKACSDVLYGSDMGRGSLSDRVSVIMLSLHGGYPLGVLGDIW